MPIEKDNFHDFIFIRCASIIEEISSFDNIHHKELIKLERLLRDTANIISNSEYNLIEAYNENNLQIVRSSLSRLIDDLFDYRYMSDNELSMYLIKTYDHLRKERRREYRGRGTRDTFAEGMNIRFEMTKPKPGFRDRSLNQSFKEYYKIVSLIVEDINNMDGWKYVSEYYKNHVIPSSPKEINKPLTFLSYAFKDNIYALFLHEYFHNAGGFLYVDSLFGTDYGSDGKKIKESLSPWIDSASQILFLHSIHSDGIKKGLSSWCSWELGEAYRDKNKKFYKVVVAGILNNHSIIDDDFKELKTVINGIIIPK